MLGTLRALLRPVPPPPGFPVPPRRVQLLSKTLGAGLWFWILYRAKKDGSTILVTRLGWRSPSRVW